jgi:nucleoside 2-deoxyribosyltransferase
MAYLIAILPASVFDMSCSHPGASLPDRALYLAGPDGFTEPGRLFHAQVLITKVTTAGWRSLDPWDSPGDLLQADATTGHAPPGADELARANHAIGRRNVELIDAADAVLANLEGTDVDSGTAAEIGYACGRGIPVVGFRTDQRRSGENEGATVNLQVEYFIRASGGEVHDSLDDALASLGQLPGRAAARG